MARTVQGKFIPPMLLLKANQSPDDPGWTYELKLDGYRTTTDPTTFAAIETAPMTLSAIRPDGSQKLEPFVDADQMTAARLGRRQWTRRRRPRFCRFGRCARFTPTRSTVRKEIIDEVSGVATL